MKKIIFIAIAIIVLNNANAQSTEKWSLRKCVDYAMKNNISVKQADVQARIAVLQLKQAKLYQLPNASFSTNVGPSFGRSLDLSTNGYNNLASLSQNYNLQGGIEIFSWWKVKNNKASAEFNLKAALSDIEKSANDVALSVATYYLQILSANQQINITKVQIQQTKNNLDATRKRVDAGALPELNALEFESQLAADSTSFVAAETNYNQSLLAMKGLLNLDAAKPFDVDIPNVETIPLENLADLQPESVYLLALDNQPNIKSNRFRIKSGEKNILVNKSGLYPSITGSYALSTGYIDYLTNTGFPKTAYFSQLDANFRQNLGVGISVPIFNNGTNRINYEQSKLNLQNTKVNEEQIEQKLKLDIYTAYSNAINALQKFNASKKQVEVAQKAFDFATKRYDVGLLNTLDLITNQNNLLRAKTQNLADQYDYVFKMKLLEFYKGQGLKL
jgi:outer membrane protein